MNRSSTPKQMDGQPVKQRTGRAGAVSGKGDKASGHIINNGQGVKGTRGAMSHSEGCCAQAKNTI